MRRHNRIGPRHHCRLRRDPIFNQPDTASGPTSRNNPTSQVLLEAYPPGWLHAPADSREGTGSLAGKAVAVGTGALTASGVKGVELGTLAGIAVGGGVAVETSADISGVGGTVAVATGAGVCSGGGGGAVDLWTLSVKLPD